MSTAEEALKPATTSRRKSAPIGNRVLDLISSVRVGVITLCVLVVLSMIGMIIMQIDVDGFEAYYVSLTPAERTVFGWLGLFDIYHAWYFYLALLYLSLNIVLASIDRFPSAWDYVVKPKITATRDWLLGRKEHAEVELGKDGAAAVEIAKAFENAGFKTTTTSSTATEYATDADGKKDFNNVVTRETTTVFGESGKWNRLGAYVVHVFLLTLFLGHFVALTTGGDRYDVRMTPGTTTDQIQLISFSLDPADGFKRERFNVQIPFSIECTDIQQTLIRQDGNIEVNNTLDWRTQVKIHDPQQGESFIADVSMNKPLDYRGYRFFQAQTIPFGSARLVTLDVTPEQGGETKRLTIDRNGSTTLADGTQVEFAQFMPDFIVGKDGKPDTASGEYNKPTAILNVTPPGGERTRVYAMPPAIADNIPIGRPAMGYKWRLADFEKSPLAHILSIKYDPFSASFIAWYIGGFGLIGALMLVFFFSHKRVWAQVEKGEDGTMAVLLAGEANRNHLGFADKFKKIEDELRRRNAGSLPASAD